MFCPKCGDELEQVADYPDTGTDADFYEVECSNGHSWTVESGGQIPTTSLREIPSPILEDIKRER